MLIDCLVYIALLALILGLAFAAFYRTLEHTTRLEQNAADIIRALRTGERWRADVRSATGPPRVIAGAKEFALRIPNSNGEIGYIFREGVVLREAAPTSQPEVLLSNVKASSFHRDSHRHAIAWRWELELQGKQKVTRVKPQFTFQAVTPVESKR
jgi:Tfp pilus assembly protein FimT